MPRLTALDGFSLREAGAPRVVIAFGECAIEQLVENDGFAHDLFGRGGIAVVEEVAAAQFDGIDADGRGNLVHVALDGEDGLGSAEAAKRAIGNGVGGPRMRTHAHVGADVRARANEAWRARARWKKGCSRRRHRWPLQCPSRAVCRSHRGRCDGERARDDAWWWRPDLPCGRRPSSRDGRSSWPAARRARR